jgi:hypothetical protein
VKYLKNTLLVFFFTEVNLWELLVVAISFIFFKENKFQKVKVDNDEVLNSNIMYYNNK